MGKIYDQVTGSCYIPLYSSLFPEVCVTETIALIVIKYVLRLVGK